MKPPDPKIPSPDAPFADAPPAPHEVYEPTQELSGMERSETGSPALAAGARVHRYVITQKLGQGGMGVVYEAADPELQRRVALKLLQADAEKEHAPLRARLLREAQALAQLSHPNVVAVYDAGTFEGKIFIAMELVQGETLRAWNRARHSWRQTLRVYEGIGAGVRAAHERGLIHRDLKPENVLIDLQGRPRVLDFGLARGAAESAPSASFSSSEERTPDPALAWRGDFDSPITREGRIVGTPSYMAPEVARGETADARSDEFSFCVALYESLYGVRPYSKAVRAGKGPWPLPTPPRGIKVPSWLARVVLRGLRFNPDERWPSMDALLGELVRADPSRRRVAFALAAALALVAITAVGVGRFSVKSPVCEGEEARVASVLSAEQLAAIHAAFAQSPESYAEESFARTRDGLVAYGQAWAQLGTEVCRATRVAKLQTEEELALRNACLDQRLQDLRSIAQVLALPDRDIADHGPRALASITPLSLCNNLEALRSPAAEPADPSVRAELAALRERLSRARALLAAGRPQDAAKLASEAHAGALRIGFQPLQAEALHVQGEAEEDQNLLAQSSATLQQGFLVALASNHRHEVAFLAAERMYTEHLRRNEDTALELEKVARAALAAAGGDELLEAQLDNTRSALDLRRGEEAHAVEEARRSLALRLKVLGPEHPLIANSLNNLANALAGVNRTAESEVDLRKAVEIKSRALGPHHPHTLTTEVNLVFTLIEEGKLDEANELFNQIFPELQAQSGHDLFPVAALLHPAVMLKRASNRPGEALPLARREVELRRSSPETDPMTLSAAQLDVAESAFETKSYALAESSARDALAGLEHLPHPGLNAFKMRVAVLAVRTKIFAAEGNKAAARKSLAAAEALFDHELSSAASKLNESHLYLGDANLALHALKPALAHGETALATVDRADPKETPGKLDELIFLGRVQLERGELAAARTAYERALAICQKNAVWVGTRGEVELGLGQALGRGANARPRVQTLLAQAAHDFQAAHDATSAAELHAFQSKLPALR